MPMPKNPMYRAGQKVRQARTATVRAVEGEERVLDFILSTESRDRYNSEVTGWILKNYRQNPAITWAHCYTIPLIGNALRIGVDEQKRLVVRGEFTPPEINEFGYGVFQSYAEGWMRTYSAGFVPESVEYVDDTDTKESKRGFYRLKKNDLLEAACVPVPANPECTTLGLMERGILARSFEPVIAAAPADFDPMNDAQVEKFMDACKALREWNGADMKAAQDKVRAFFAKRGAPEVVECWSYGDNACHNCGTTDDSTHLLDCPQARTVAGEKRDKEGQRTRLNAPSLTGNGDGDDSPAAILASMAEVVSTSIEASVAKTLRDLGFGNNTAMRGAIPYKKQKLAPQDEAFNAATEAAAASVDDLWEMSAWFKGEGEKKADFKMIHHKQAGYETVFRGVAASMVALSGGRGGVTVPANEKARVYRHLVLHYKEFDAEAPELKAYDEQGELRDCTPELFFERIADADRVSRGDKFMRNQLAFARAEEGADTPTPVATIKFLSGELDIDAATVTNAVDDMVPESFAGVFAFAMEHATKEQRARLSSSLVHMQLRSMDLAAPETAVRFADALVDAIRAMAENRTQAAQGVEAVTMLRDARDEEGLTLDQIAARVPLTLADIQWLDAVTVDGLRVDEQARAMFTARAAIVGAAIGVDADELKAAVERDVAAAVKAGAGDASRTNVESAMLLLRAALGQQGDNVTPPAPETRTGENDDDDDSDEGSSLGDAYLSGTVDAARKRLRGKAHERGQRNGDGGGRNQSAKPDVHALAAAMQAGSK